MKALLEDAGQLQEFLESLGWEFCFIGGLAVLHWGEPRLTRDLDVNVLTGFGREEPFIGALLKQYRSRIEDAASFALENRVLLLESESGHGIDVALGGLPFEEFAIQRSRKCAYGPGIHLRICSPEDLIVMKAFADRPIDWQDIHGIVVRQGNDAIDWDYLFPQLIPLADAKERPEIVTKLQGIAAGKGKAEK